MCAITAIGAVGRRRRRLLLAVTALQILASSPAATAQQILFQRGDANCSGFLNAADVVASARGFGISSVCGNEDCDRDGDITAADLVCATSCLFGSCPVPEHAPRVNTAEPVGVPQIAPNGVVRLTGSNFRSDGSIPSVLIGGLPADFVELTPPDTIDVLVPPLPPGVVTAVLLNGDLAGEEFPLTLSASTPIGDPDTFAEALALIDTVLARFVDLPLEESYGEETAAVRQNLERIRGELATQWAELSADPRFTAEARATLDAAIDSSGAPETLREEIAAIEGMLEPLADATNGGGAQTVAVRGARIGNTVRVVAGVGRGAAGALSVPALIAIGVSATIAAGVVAAAGNPLTPLIFALEFRDASAAPRRFPTASGFVTVRGARLGTASLNARTRKVSILIDPATSGSDYSEFRLAEPPGLCGYTTFQLLKDFGIQSNLVGTRIQPELLGLGVSRAVGGKEYRLTARGVAGCDGRAEYFGTLLGASIASSALGPVSGLPNTLVTRAPRIIPQTYRVRVEIPPLLSEETKLLEITTALRGIEVACEPLELTKRSDVEEQTRCSAKPVPPDEQYPRSAEVSWYRDGLAISLREIDGDVGERIRGYATQAGESSITATLTFGDLTFTSNAVTVTVKDGIPPTLTIQSLARVPPGAAVSVSVAAEDNTDVAGLVLYALGDAVLDPEQEYECGLEKTCSNTFTVDLKSTGFSQQLFTLHAEAFDSADNAGTTAAITVMIRPPDSSPPVVHIDSPQNNGRVRAGDVVQVSVRLTDNQPGDTGIKRVKVTASGLAVESEPIPAEVELPQPLPQATRLTSFVVRPASILANIVDRTIIITAEGVDDSGRMASDTIFVTAGGPPVISSVSPERANPGAIMRIAGDGFGESQGSGTVKIGAAMAAVTSWSNGAILATVPALAPGLVDVVVTVDGQASDPYQARVLGTGDVQVTLTWNDSNDLDLYVVDPLGETLYYLHRTSASGGKFDVDDNSNCEFPGSSGATENTYWPAGTAPGGRYIVRVDYYDNCTDPATPSNFKVTVRVGDRIIDLFPNGRIDPNDTLEASFDR